MAAVNSALIRGTSAAFPASLAFAQPSSAATELLTSLDGFLTACLLAADGTATSYQVAFAFTAWVAIASFIVGTAVQAFARVSSTLASAPSSTNQASLAVPAFDPS